VSPFWRRVWEQGRSDWLLAAGQYTVTPDHRPLLGPTVVDGLYLNAGWSGHGVMGSAAGSELLVDQIVGRRAAASNPFRVDRVMVARERDVL
jgi:glycine/D-amino acid oxidase-like deaminating enzyme